MTTGFELSRRKFLALAGAGAVACVSGGARAEPPVIYTDPVPGVALEGYDAVAYFTEGLPREGSEEHAFEWQGATWRFATRENRDRFAADPEAYAPQYGGYCAWAMAEDYTAHGDPHAWRIVDGRLYLNYNARIHRRWERDIPGNITRANSNWPGVLER